MTRPTAGASCGASAGLLIPLQGVVEDDPVVVVQDLRLVAELDRLAEAALGDRPGIAVVQAYPPGGSLGGGPGQPLAGLGRDLAGGRPQYRPGPVPPRQPAPGPGPRPPPRPPK